MGFDIVVPVAGLDVLVTGAGADVGPGVSIVGAVGGNRGALQSIELISVSLDEDDEEEEDRDI